MKKVIYIDSKEALNLNSNLISLFSAKIKSDFLLTSSFLNLANDQFPIFTKLNNFIIKKIQENNIFNYGIILDAADSQSLDIDNIKIGVLNQAKFIFLLGNVDKAFSFISNFKNTKTFSKVLLNIDVDSSPDINYTNVLIVESDNLGNFIEDLTNNNLTISNKRKVIILDKNLTDKNFWINQLELRGINASLMPANIASIEFILSKKCCVYNPISSVFCQNSINNKIGFNDHSIKIDKFKEILIQEINNNIFNYKNDDTINIVCYKPSYLFKDLVDRFVDAGCVHSDFPLPNCHGYIWMRPQEIWHLEYLKAGLTHKEISKSYIDNARNILNNLDINLIKSKSVAIHHGTCFDPLYQFDPFLLTKSLFNVKKVVGVCEIEECYSPSYGIANKNNFVFVPIGFDNNLFSKDKINNDLKIKESPINILFVGRAYGTNDKKLLTASRMAEPKGYRKGGDILLNIVLRLKLRNIPFILHILGQNWDDLVDQLEKYDILYKYYARDKNITYNDYPSVYSKADVLLISARCEGGPVSAIEALSLGVPVVSTNVGVVKYLDKFIKNGVYTFDYDKKWHIADIDRAINNLLEIYNSETSVMDRLELSRQVLDFTTSNWINRIIEEAYK